MRGWHGIGTQREADRMLMKFVTDGRSGKVRESELLSEVCWWFPRTSEQFRIRGQLRYVGGEVGGWEGEARVEQWGRMRGEAREQFFWPAPGEVWGGEEQGGSREEGPKVEEGEDEEEIPPPPDNFLLMLLDPVAVDHLDLKKNVRYKHERGEGREWDEGVRVNP